MPETKQQESQSFTRPALKPFVKPLVDEPRPPLRPAAPAFGRVTLPPFGPIRYGGPKPGAAREDDEEPTWASIEEYVQHAPAPEVPDAEPEPYVAAEPTAEMETAASVPVAEVAETVVDDTGLFDDELPLPPVAEQVAVAEQAAVAEDVVVAGEVVVDERPPVAEEPPAIEQRDEPMPWDAAPEPEPEPVVRRPVLPLTGPSDPTPIMNPTIERTIERTTEWTLERTTERSTEPHRMTPMRVTPLRPAAIPATPTPMAASPDSNARAIAAALEMVAARVRRGDLVVTGSMPSNDDPPALAAVLAATAAALLGVRA